METPLKVRSGFYDQAKQAWEISGGKVSISIESQALFGVSVLGEQSGVL